MNSKKLKHPQRIIVKPKNLHKERVLGKLQIWAKPVKDSRGDHTKIVHKDLSNKNPPKNFARLGRNAKNENHPKIVKKKNAQEKEREHTKIT